MSTKSKYTFINTGGTHYTIDGTIVKKGERFGSDIDLRKKFLNHFELVNEADPADEGANDGDDAPSPAKRLKTAGQSPSEAAISVTDDTASDESDSDSLAAYGSDVTKNYPTAKKAELKVFETEDGKFQIVDPADSKAPLNPKPISAKKVEGFLANYLD